MFGKGDDLRGCGSQSVDQEFVQDRVCNVAQAGDRPSPVGSRLERHDSGCEQKMDNRTKDYSGKDIDVSFP